MPPIDDIRLSIESQLAALDEELAHLTAALQALDDDRTPRRARRPRSAPTRAPRRQTPANPVVAPPKPIADRTRPVRRRRAELSGDRLEAVLTESGEGLSAVALARQLSVSSSRVISVLRELEAAGKARREGSRSTSRWRVVTDEERVAERAAQLAAQSRAAQT
jgi:hypothetical protein